MKVASGEWPNGDSLAESVGAALRAIIVIMIN